MSYEADTSIDKNNLDDEWVKQADLFYAYSEKANNAYKVYNDLKNHYNVKKAEVELNIRKGKVDIGIAKLTENAISSYLDSQQDLVKLNNNIADAKYEYEMYNSAVYAMEHKKRALEYITKLHLSNYFADTSDYDSYRNEMLKKQRSE